MARSGIPRREAVVAAPDWYKQSKPASNAHRALMPSQMPGATYMGCYLHWTLEKICKYVRRCLGEQAFGEDELPGRMKGGHRGSSPDRSASCSIHLE